jgi:hypothetical protein
MAANALRRTLPLHAWGVTPAHRRTLRASPARPRPLSRGEAASFRAEARETAGNSLRRTVPLHAWGAFALRCRPAFPLLGNLH